MARNMRKKGNRAWLCNDANVVVVVVMVVIFFFFFFVCVLERFVLLLGWE